MPNSLKPYDSNEINRHYFSSAGFPNPTSYWYIFTDGKVFFFELKKGDLDYIYPEIYLIKSEETTRYKVRSSWSIMTPVTQLTGAVYELRKNPLNMSLIKRYMRLAGVPDAKY